MIESSTPDEPSAGSQYTYAAHDLVREPELWSRPGNLWPLDAGFAAELDRRLHVRQPRTIVEVGSGSSTLILARYASANPGVKVFCLEHDERFAKATLELLESEGLAGAVEINARPLTKVYVGSPDSPECVGPWYHNDDLPPMIDFVLVDGPPERLGGRAAVLPALWDRLLKGSGGWEMWLDDAGRPGERDAVKAWQRWQPSLCVRELPFGKNGAVMLSGDGHVYADGHIDASDVALTILTARRPHLLGQQLDSLRAHAPGLLDTAQVFVMHNSARVDDPITASMIDVLRCAKLESTTMRPIGPALTSLELMTRRSGAKYWLHLEDDWAVATVAAGWLNHAQQLLDGPIRSLDFAQVRLRHYSEPVLGRHMVTRRPLTLRPVTQYAVPYLVYDDSHLTFNPFLARVGALTGLFPTSGEHEFQGNAHALGYRRVAQLYPGVFRHIGGGAESLRERQPGRGY